MKKLRESGALYMLMEYLLGMGQSGCISESTVKPR